MKDSKQTKAKLKKKEQDLLHSGLFKYYYFNIMSYVR